jgi:hypothetical protein
MPAGDHGDPDRRRRPCGPVRVGDHDRRLSAVWRCVTLLADVDRADALDRVEAGDAQRPPSRLVRRPMATMTRREWTWRVVATEALCNTAYLLHVGGS